VNAHARIYGNKIADRLVKEATQKYHVTRSRIGKERNKKDNRKESIRKWQNQWEETTKTAIMQTRHTNSRPSDIPVQEAKRTTEKL